MMDFQAIEAALHAWASSRLGITVRWANQRAPQPAYPYATLKLSGPTTVGRDEVRITTDLGRPAGEEVELLAGGQRELSLALNVYAKAPRDGAYDQAQSAIALACEAQASLALPTVQDALRAGGLAVLEVGAIQDLTFLQDADFVERMQLDVRLGVASNVAERTGYIATARVTSDFGAAGSVELLDVPLGE